MALGEEAKMNSQRMWQENEPHWVEGDLAQNLTHILGATVQANDTGAFVKVRLADGSDMVLTLHPMAARHLGMLLMKAADAMGAVNLTIHAEPIVKN